VRCSGSGSGLWGNWPSGVQFTATTWATPKRFSSLGTAMPPTEFTASTAHLEVSRPDGGHVHQVQRQDGRDVLVGPCIIRAHAAQVVHRGEGEGIAFGQAQHLGTYLPR
jgi:hypothetical protein